MNYIFLSAGSPFARWVRLLALAAAWITSGSVGFALTLAWDASADSSVVGYRLKYGPSSGNYTAVKNVGNKTTETIPSPNPGETVFIVVTAINSTSVESLPSNEVSFTTPGGTLSTNANLSSVVLSGATLSPSFSSGTTGYSASVSNSTTSITVRPTVAQAGATVKVNGVTVTSGTISGAMTLAAGPNVIQMVVTAQDGVTTKTYTLTVTRSTGSNANLAGFVPSTGTLTPAFASGTKSYAVTVPNTTNSITVRPTVAEAGATVKVNGVAVVSGSSSGVMALEVGPNIIRAVVTAQNGTTTKTYTLMVIRTPSVVPDSTNANLAALVPSTGTIAPVFSSGETSYTLTVPNSTASITVMPTVQQADATVKVNGVPGASGTASGVMTLAVGPNVIRTVVTAQDDTTARTYTLTVTRAPSANAELSSLVASIGMLTPGFAKTTTNYTASVPNATASMTVRPTVAQADATVKVNGVTVASGITSGAMTLAVGPNVIRTVVTAQDGTTTKTYTLTVTRAPAITPDSANADLISLAPSAGRLTPSFSKTGTSYTVNVSNATTSLAVTPTTDQGNATVKVDGVSVASGSASPAKSLGIGPNIIDVVVTAQNGTTTKTYRLTVNRARREDDLNGDGNSDIVFQNSKSGQVVAWLMNGFGSATGLLAIGQSSVGDWRICGMSDLDGDGIGDIILQNDAGQITGWLMDGEGTVRSSVSIHQDDDLGDWRVVAVGDLDGDGISDLVLQNDAMQIAGWLMDGSGTPTSWFMIDEDDSGDWRVVGMSDLDADGISDLLLQNDAGQVTGRLMDGEGTASTSMWISSTALGDWKVVGLKDLNGDGISDLVFQNTPGQVKAWLMDDQGSRTSEISLNSSGMGDWRVH
jgi:hypothetical protein